jgi:hypothetical protein
MCCDNIWKIDDLPKLDRLPFSGQRLLHPPNSVGVGVRRAALVRCQLRTFTRKRNPKDGLCVSKGCAEEKR